MGRRKPSHPQQQPRERRRTHQPRPVRGSGEARTAPLWLFGQHAVLAALDNPKRRLKRLVALPHMVERLSGWRGNAPAPEFLEKAALEQLLPPGASHQGLAVLSDPLKVPDLAELLGKLATPDTAARPLLVLLDQVTDPRNCGAVLRSAAAFGASAVVVPQDSSAPESGALAKAASGALEAVPYIRVTNLARALERIKAAGFWCLGLAGEAEQTLAEADPGGPIALVLGAEGSGLRRLTRERCDLLVRLPTAGLIDSLNVSNAAAVALYIASGRR